MLGRSCQINTVDKDARRAQERALPQLERIDHVAPIDFDVHQIELKPAVQLVKKSQKTSGRTGDNEKERKIEAGTSMD
jgi:hypothetical protein